MKAYLEHLKSFLLRMAACTEEVRNDTAQAEQATSHPVKRASPTPDQAFSSTDTL